jgi:A/G-specific adenine glycosylase
MELGATVCLPKAPGCGDCPLRRVCRARRDDRQYDLPLRKPKTELPHFTIVAGVIFRPDGKILVDRRPRDGLLGGLWEFPGGKVKPGETKVAALKREVREELNLDIDVDEPMTVVRHAYSHFRITLHAFRCRLAGGRARAIGCEEFRWVSPRRLGRLAFPKANHPILQRIQSEVHE